MPKFPDDNPAVPRRGYALKGVGYSQVREFRTVFAKWPRKPLTPPSEAQLHARSLIKSAALICTIIDANQMNFSRQVAEHTQLLPRDFMIIQLFNRAFTFVRPDGKKIYAMVAIRDVSDLLDAIGQLPGMILFRGEDIWQSLPAGAEDQALVMGPDGLPTWGAGAGAGGVSILDTFDLAGQSFYELDLTPYASGYPVIEVHFNRVVPTSDGVLFQSQVATTSHSSYWGGGSDYKYAHTRVMSTPDLQTNGGSTSSMPFNNGNGIGNGADEGFDFVIRSTNWTDAAQMPRFRYDGTVATDNNLIVRFEGAAQLRHTDSVTKMAFAFNAGNFASGTCQIVGYNG